MICGQAKALESEFRMKGSRRWVAFGARRKQVKGGQMKRRQVGKPTQTRRRVLKSRCVGFGPGLQAEALGPQLFFLSAQVAPGVQA